MFEVGDVVNLRNQTHPKLIVTKQPCSLSDGTEMVRAEYLNISTGLVVIHLPSVCFVKSNPKVL